MIRGIKWGCVDPSGEYVIPPRFDNIFGFHNGFSIFEIAGKCGVLDIRGNVLVEPIFESIHLPDDAGLCSARVGSKWGYYDFVLKEWVIPPSFDEAYGFGNGRAFVGLGGKYGLIDRRGHFVVHPKWDEVTQCSLREGIPWAGENGRKYVIDFNGESLHGPYHRIIGGSSDNPLYVSGESFSGVITANGNPLAPSTNWVAVSWFQSGVIVACTDEGGFAIVDITGNLKRVPQCDYLWRFSEGVATIVIGQKTGIVDIFGDIKVDAIFDGPLEFDLQQSMSTGLIGVKKNGLWGFVDKSGDVRIDFKYQQVRSFACGLATVSVSEKK